ncbi:unnamed protein product [Closterium sp. NIES-65]|nr:unnamed protein product [Closterium sp. NIES-65]
MGLGLAVCKRFVSMMGGHIWVESEGPGKGTTVTFVVRLGLPEKADDRTKAGNAGQKQAAGGAGGATKAVDFTGLKVLVCDDNHVNRMVTKRMVTRLGCEVTVVGSGRECLAALAGPGHGFKVLLQDLMMPDMDGYEVAKRVIDRIKNPDERPRIAALTANTDQATKDRCLSIGMDGVITKPISLEKMRIVFTELMTLGKIVSDPKA